MHHEVPWARMWITNAYVKTLRLCMVASSIFGRCGDPKITQGHEQIQSMNKYATITKFGGKMKCDFEFFECYL